MIEKIVVALRRAAIVILKNLWLFAFGFAYTLAAPVFFLGGTGLPILFWAASGRYFEPGLLWRDPLSFLLSHWQLILFSMAGCFVGFTLYLVVVLFYHGALTGSVARAAPAEALGALSIPGATFFQEGRKNFTGSLATATLASLLPLFPGIILFGLGLLFLLKLPSLLTLGELNASPALVVLGLAALGFGLLSVIIGWLAFLWYRYALCALCVESLPAGRAMRRALDFFAERWPLVLGLVVASLVLGVICWMLTAPLGFLTRFAEDISQPLALALRVLIIPLSLVLGVFMELWFKAALVVLYIENR
jgi:hypothetical protein